ncbi:MAG: hemolysin family protein [Jiangellales bacterium]
MTEALLLLGLAAVLIAANALFVAAEFSLVTVDRTTIEAQAPTDRSAARVLGALRSLSTQLSGAQLGITVTSLLVGFLAEPSLATLLAGPLEAWGVSSAAVAVGLALAIATTVQMVFGELVPKNWAISEPMSVAKAVAAPHMAFTAAMGWLISFLNGSANRLLRAMGIEPTEELESARSAQELRSLIRRSASEGTLERPVASLLDRSLRLTDRVVADVLTPRPQVHSLDVAATVSTVLEVARETGHSRFPVTGAQGIDSIVGVIDLRRALLVDPAQAGRVRVGQVMDEPLFVPETLPVDDLLHALRADGHLAVVVDEYGGTAGVATLEDIVEEIVGEVADESDPHEFYSQQQPDGTLLLSGLLRTDEARDLGVPADDAPEYETLGGLAMRLIGAIPAVGDQFSINGRRAVVARMDGRRVELIRVDPAVEATDE